MNTRLQKSSATLLFFFFGALVFAAALLFFLGVASRYLAAHGSAAAAFAEIDADRGRAQDIQLQAQVAELTKDQRASLLALAVPQGGGADFIAGIENLGRQANVSASVASVAAAAPHGTAPGALTLVVTFTGSYGDCLRFVALLETVHRSVEIPSLILQYNALTHAWTGTVTVSALSFETP